jgi:hypothetical protein
MMDLHKQVSGVLNYLYYRYLVENVD